MSLPPPDWKDHYHHFCPSCHWCFLAVWRFEAVYNLVSIPLKNSKRQLGYFNTQAKENSAANVWKCRGRWKVNEGKRVREVSLGKIMASTSSEEELKRLFSEGLHELVWTTPQQNVRLMERKHSKFLPSPNCPSSVSIWLFFHSSGAYLEQGSGTWETGRPIKPKYIK